MPGNVPRLANEPPKLVGEVRFFGSVPKRKWRKNKNASKKNTYEKIKHLLEKE